jgi:hypothetical protein
MLMAEVMGECTHIPYHLKKLVLVLSAMRHFAAALTAPGAPVRYVRLDDPANAQSLRGEVARAVAELVPRQVVVTEPDHRVVADMQTWDRGPGDRPGHPLRLLDRRISPLGKRTKRFAPGVLRSRHAPPEFHRPARRAVRLERADGNAAAELAAHGTATARRYPRPGGSVPDAAG